MIKTLVSAAVMAGALAMSGAAMAQDRSLTINNQTDNTITVIQATPVSQSTWGPDLLEGTLAPGESGSGTLSGGADGACNFDFRATLDDGSTATLRNVNVCEVSEINVTE